MALKAFLQCFDRLRQFNYLLAANGELFVLLFQTVFHLVSQDTQSKCPGGSQKERRRELHSTFRTVTRSHLEYENKVTREWKLTADLAGHTL